MELMLGDRLEMKKPHPCGGKVWVVLRVGMDLRLRCENCGHEIMAPRVKLEKGIKRKLECTDA